MSVPVDAPALDLLDDDQSDEAFMQLIFQLTTVAASIMLRTSETVTLIETAGFQVLLSTEFKLSKTDKGRGIKFDGLIETEEGKVITFGLIIPCEEALFARSIGIDARTH